MEIMGSAGSIAFGAFDFGPIELTTEAGTQQLDCPVPEHVQQPLIETVVDDLLGRGICPSTGKSAARTNQVIDRIYASWKKGGEEGV